MAREWPAPLEGNTLHFVGDLHFGVTKHSYEMATIRNGRMKDDLLTSRVLPTVDARVQIGDYTETSAVGEYAEANAWTNEIAGAWYGVTGNHDLWGVRGPVSAMSLTSWTHKTANWVQDLGFAQLIGIGVVNSAPYVGVDQIALDYLDDALTAATKDCIVLCHVPLPNTVLAADEANEYSTRPGAAHEMELEYVGTTTTTIPEILEAQPNAKLYVSGHTHSKMDSPDLVKYHDLGARNIVTLNCSAPVYTKVISLPGGDPIMSVFATFRDTLFGPVIQFRVRDHGGRCWGTFDGGAKVVSHGVPA